MLNKSHLLKIQLVATSKVRWVDKRWFIHIPSHVLRSGQAAKRQPASEQAMGLDDVLHGFFGAPLEIHFPTTSLGVPTDRSATPEARKARAVQKVKLKALVSCLG